ncbi:MAG: dihydropteroate synthase [Pseudomonadota bacterium]|nr:dihydropteroate synthase [Pseudomonadota bacterium]
MSHSMKNREGNAMLACGRHRLDISYPRVMGILNVTPDSFSDGGNFNVLDAALEHAQTMLAQGAAVIDVGGESTRPGAATVSEQQELDRVVPVVEALVRELDALVSVDTSNPAVMREVIGRGAGMINDVRSLRRPGALEVAAASGLPICLMHMVGEPGDMQAATDYAEPIEQAVADFLKARIAECERAGIRRERLILDPGFGFAKTVGQNLRLLNRLDTLGDFDLPLLAGMSRKSMIGKVLDRPVEERLPGGLALVSLAVERGARLLRVHDVGPSVDAINMTWAVLQEDADR